MATNIFSSSESSVTVGSEKIEGVQSIEYKVVRNITSNYGFGSMTRTSVSYGNKVVTGTIKVKSHSAILDKMVHNKDMNEKTNMNVHLQQASDSSKDLTFENIFIEDRSFSMDVSGVGLSVYTFSASDITGGESS